MTERAELFNSIIDKMPEEWRNRWCEATVCACAGAANCGGLSEAGFTKQDWLEWKRREDLKRIKAKYGMR